MQRFMRQKRHLCHISPHFWHGSPWSSGLILNVDVHDVHELDRSGAGPISSPIHTVQYIQYNKEILYRTGRNPSLGDSGAVALSAVLPQCAALECLCLNDNQIGYSVKLKMNSMTLNTVRNTNGDTITFYYL